MEYDIRFATIRLRSGADPGFFIRLIFFCTLRGGGNFDNQGGGGWKYVEY